MWRVAAAAVRGSSHERKGQPCQDAYRWHLRPDGSLLAAVADGAGSAAFSELASAAAVRAAVEALASGELPGAGDGGAWHARLGGALEAALAAVQAAAAERDAPLRELATTLIVAAAAPELVAVAQIGDGAAVAADAQGALVALTRPQFGEHLNETTFLISPGALDGASKRVWHGRAARLALFSDGLQMLALKMPEAAPHPPFFAPLFRFVAAAADAEHAEKQLAAFLASPRVAARSDDDRTLLLAARIDEISPREADAGPAA